MRNQNRHENHVWRDSVAKTSVRLLSFVLIAFIAASLYPSSALAASTELEYVSTKAMGSTGSDVAETVATDSAGNIYKAGRFSGTVNFNPDGSDMRTSNGSTDCYLTSYTEDGTYRWTKAFGGTSTDRIEDIAFDSEDNIYVTGSFFATANFNPDGSDSQTSAGERDVFVSKWNANGTYGWTRIVGDSARQQGRGLAVDANGHIYVIGNYRGTIDFDIFGGTDTHLNSGGNNDMFITKWNANGTYGWTKTFGSAGDDEVGTIALDSQGNPYIAGEYRLNAQPNINFNPDGSDIHVGSGYLDAFITKWNADGTYGWTKSYVSFGGNWALGVAISGEDVYAAGYFSGTMNFHSSGGTDSRTSTGGNDVFLTKITTDGTYGWTKTFGGTSQDIANDISLGATGNVYLTGYFSGTADFNPDGVDSRTSSGSSDMFLAAFSPEGDYKFTRTTGGTGADQAYDVATGADGRLYQVGSFSSTVNFNPDGIDSRTSSGLEDTYISSFVVTDYHYISGVPTGIDIVDPATGISATDSQLGIEYSPNKLLRLLTDDGTPIADINVDMTSDSDWSGIAGGVDLAAGKSYVHGLEAAINTIGTYSLYVPKLPNHQKVGICPGATSLGEVSPSCLGLLYYSEQDTNVSVVNIDAQDYWVVSGLSGTGGFSSEDLDEVTYESLAETGSLSSAPIAMGLLLIGASSYYLYLRRSYQA